VSDLTENLVSIGDRIRMSFSAKDAAREKVLPLCREVIRYCSQAIRATHRQEFDQAKKLLESAHNLLNEMEQTSLPTLALSEMPRRNLLKVVSH